MSDPDAAAAAANSSLTDGLAGDKSESGPAGMVPPLPTAPAGYVQDPSGAAMAAAVAAAAAHAADMHHHHHHHHQQQPQFHAPPAFPQVMTFSFFFPPRGIDFFYRVFLSSSNRAHDLEKLAHPTLVDFFLSSSRFYFFVISVHLFDAFQHHLPPFFFSPFYLLSPMIFRFPLALRGHVRVYIPFCLGSRLCGKIFC